MPTTTLMNLRGVDAVSRDKYFAIRLAAMTSTYDFRTDWDGSTLQVTSNFAHIGLATKPDLVNATKRMKVSPSS